MKELKTIFQDIDSRFQEIDKLIKEMHVMISKLEGEGYTNLRRETCDLPRIHMRYYLNEIEKELKKIA